MKQNSPSDHTIGFVSVMQNEAEWLGGLLLLSAVGKPLEFHCTAPVKPTAAHEVLYGPTLNSYVLADNVAPKLFAALKQQPAIICTDCIEMTAAPIEQCNVVFVDCQTEATDETDNGAIVGESQHESQEFAEEQQKTRNAIVPSTPHESQSRILTSLEQFSIEELQLAIASDRKSAKSEVVSLLRQFAAQIDLTEPFERIHHAIQQSYGIKSQEAA